MHYGSGELRRAARLTDLVTAQLSAVCLGSCARDVRRADLAMPLAPGEISLRGRVSVLQVRNLLISRGFRHSGWSGGTIAREPVYSRPD
jgi:mRNA-degrading endonuclease toxin of MazEF toxin-antitoxin module